MKTTTYQQLLEQTTFLYNTEREIAGIFSCLDMNTTQPIIKEGLAREAEENKKQCARLEGLLQVLSQHPASPVEEKETFCSQFTITLKRILTKHASFGYSSAILAAMQLGQNEIANVLKQPLAIAKAS